MNFPALPSSRTLHVHHNVNYVTFTEFTKEEEIGLSTHNEFRQIHQVPLMTLDRTMCDEAKAYAEKIAKMGKLEHSSRKDRHRQGENLSYGCSSNAPQTMEEAVTNW